MIRVSPSILAADFANLEREIGTIKQAGAELEGVGIAIEKGFQPGRKVLEEKGARVESLAIIEKMGNGSITFKEHDN
mgnify:CR=1 FL=1